MVFHILAGIGDTVDIRAWCVGRGLVAPRWCANVGAWLRNGAGVSERSLC